MSRKKYLLFLASLITSAIVFLLVVNAIVNPKPRLMTIDEARELFTANEAMLTEIAEYVIANPPRGAHHILSPEELEKCPPEIQKQVYEYNEHIAKGNAHIAYECEEVDVADLKRFFFSILSPEDAPEESDIETPLETVAFSLRSVYLGKDEENAEISVSQRFVYYKGTLSDNWESRLQRAQEREELQREGKLTGSADETRGAWKLNDHWLFASLRN